MFGVNKLTWSFVYVNLQRKLGLLCALSTKSSRQSHGMTTIFALLYSPWPFVTWGSYIILDLWKGPRGGYCIVAFNACNKSASMEGMKGVSQKISRMPPSSKTTLHSRFAITKFEPHFFGQHKLIEKSNGTWKMQNSTCK